MILGETKNSIRMYMTGEVRVRQGYRDKFQGYVLYKARRRNEVKIHLPQDD
jgi:hypothetical protein